MNSSLLLVSGLAWLMVGIIVGNFIAINRLIHNFELQEKLEDLRKIRLEAERARTIYHVAKMMERVNQNLLLDIFKQIDKDLAERLKNANKN